MRGACLVTLLALLVCACSGDGSRCAWFPGGSRYCLQPATEVAPFSVQQKVDIAFNGGKETVIAQIEADAQGMRFVGVTPFGQKLVQLRFDNRQVKVEASSMKGMDPVLLLALVQLALWPADDVDAGLGGSWNIDDGENSRRLVKDGVELVSIQYTRGRSALSDMVVQLPGAGVELVISNLDDVDMQ